MNSRYLEQVIVAGVNEGSKKEYPWVYSESTLNQVIGKLFLAGRSTYS